MFKNKGLVYPVLDAGGNRVEVSVKAISIYCRPTLARLEKMLRNKEARKQHRETLRA